MYKSEGTAELQRLIVKSAIVFSPLAVVPAFQNGYCHYNQSELTAQVSGYFRVDSGNATALKAALYKRGPVAVNLDASHKSFAFYANGIYYEPQCGECDLVSELEASSVGRHLGL